MLSKVEHIKAYCRFWIAFYAFLFAITVPGIWPQWMDIPKFFAALFSRITRAMGAMLNTPVQYNLNIESDSMGMYLQCLLLVFLAFMFAVIALFISKERVKKLVVFIEKFIAYYLAYAMLLYGFNKLFKVQFYSPEPNTLFTTVGQMQRDFLFWTSMGTSRLFSVVTGAIEVIAGLLILHPRTKRMGFVLAFICMANIFLINLSFDISVKLLSATLLLISAYLSFKPVRTIVMDLLGAVEGKATWANKAIVIVIAGFIIIATLVPYFQTGNFNDDIYKRPIFHGAYDVKEQIFFDYETGERREPVVRWKRCFVHRRGYFIVQDANDAMESFEIKVDTLCKQFFLSQDSLVGRFNYLLHKDTMLIEGNIYKDSINVTLAKINLDSLPLNRYKLRYIAE